MVVATSCGPLAELHYVVVVMPWHTRAAGKSLSLCCNPFVSQSAGSRQRCASQSRVSPLCIYTNLQFFYNKSRCNDDVDCFAQVTANTFVFPNFNPLIFKERQADLDYDLCHSEASEREILPPCKHDFGTSVTSVGLGRYFKRLVG